MPFSVAFILNLDVPWPSTVAGQITPEGVGAARGDAAAELDRPCALAAELRPPRPQAACGEVEGMLVGEPDRAVRLGDEPRAHAGGLRPPDLGGGDVAGLGLA